MEAENFFRTVMKGETRNEESEEEELRRKELENVEMELEEKKSDDSEITEESEKEETRGARRHSRIATRRRQKEKVNSKKKRDG